MVRTSEVSEDQGYYQNSAGAYSPKSTPEAEVHVQDLNIPRSMPHLIRDDLHVRADQRSKGHLLTPALKEIRPTRTELFLERHAEDGHESILFVDKKIFNIEEQYNRQNNNTYAQTSCDVKEKVQRVQKGHHPSYDMVLWWVSHPGVTTFHFCDKDVKTGARLYQEDVLKRVVTPLNTTGFNCQKWVFQQDSSPVNEAKTTQQWLRRHVPSFISSENWPSGCPGLKPWTINCGLFWRTWLANSGTTTWRVSRDPL